MKSFESQLIIILLVIISMLIYRFVYLRVLKMMEKKEGSSDKVAEGVKQKHVMKIEPRSSVKEMSDSKGQ